MKVDKVELEPRFIVWSDTVGELPMTLTELSIVVCELTKLVAATVELDDGLITTPLDVWLDAWVVTVVVDNAG